VREGLSSARLVGALRAAGEITRLRLLALLAQGEYNVKDLTQILSQSQPRLSRHLKLLTDAGLIVRFQEGSSVFFRLRERGEAALIVERMLTALDAADPVIARDQARAEAVKRERGEAAQAYFQSHAAAWDEIRAMHAPEEQVEAAILALLGPGPFGLIADLGTGTGRILELVAPRARRAVGYDINRNMLSYARAKLASGGIGHAQVRQGDIFSIDLGEASADAVIIHQVLHFLDDPAKAVAEAARILKPGGRLLIADFAPHALDTLREDYSHRRLGFDRGQVEAWFERLGLRAADYRTVEAPRDSKDKLTVSLWLAIRPGKLAEPKREDIELPVES
jgi:ubiquinone/menaquinone biosynthesis C-methylase UbiE/DNA-binding transcriptional ArsR family regulator